MSDRNTSSKTVTDIDLRELIRAYEYQVSAFEKGSRAPFADVVLLALKELSNRRAFETGCCAWLIERNYDGGNFMWLAILSIMPQPTWTGDASKAVRFCRKQDAENVIEGVKAFIPAHWNLKATEHLWQSPVKTPASRCGNCGADLSNHPTSASAHKCP